MHLGVERFHPAGPAYPGQGRGHGRGRLGVAVLEQFQRGQGQGRVHRLVRAGQPEGKPGAYRPADGTVGEKAVFLECADKVATVQEEGAAALAAAGGDHRDCLGIVCRANHRYALLDDARLFPGNGRDPGAQVLLVVAADVREEADQRRDHVGGVQPAAHAGLEHSRVHLFFGEPEKRQQGGGLEVRGLAIAEHGLQPLDHRGEARLADALAIDTEALTHAAQVRRGIEAGAIAGRGEDGGKGRAHRALAVGAGDVQDRQAALRAAQVGQ